MKSKNIIVIDFGSHSLKLMEADIRPPYRVRKYGQAFLEAFHGDTCSDETLYINTLSTKLKELGCRGKNCILTFHHPSIIIRELVLPRMQSSSLRENILMEMAEYLPIVLDEYIIDYRTLTESDQEENQQVMVAACPREIVETYIKIAAACGLQIKVLDIHINAASKALQYLLQFDLSLEDNPALMIDLGHRFLTMIIISKQQVISHKVIDMEIIEHLPFGESQYMTRILSECSRFLDYYYLSSSPMQVRDVYLHGGGSSDYNVRSCLQEALHLSVKDITNLHEYFPQTLPANDMFRYMNCFGALIRVGGW